MPLEPRRPGSGRISHASRFAAPAILFLTFATFGATISYAQDQQDQTVAEAARQERARKQELQRRAKHVYTEEDLKHPNILTPEDRAQIEAKQSECAQKNAPEKNCPPAPTQNSPASLDANSPAPGSSLGEIARQLRKQKELQALKPKQTEPFHLPVETPALASPILPDRPAIRLPSQPVLRPKISSPKIPSDVFRRDPFSAVPLRPEVHRPEIRATARPKVSSDAHPKVHEAIFPTVRPNVHPDFAKDVRPALRARPRLIVPAQPKVSSRPGTPGILLHPMQPPAPLAQPNISAEPLTPVASMSAPISAIRPSQPQPALSPAAATQKTVRVQRGDSLWKLALQDLGRGNRWPELLAVNPRIVDPNQIRVGAKLNLPEVAAAPAAARNANTGAAITIKVRKGDTLWNLAKSNLGRFSAWRCLAAANPSLSDPHRIYEGQLLVLPATCYSTRASSPSRASP
jgi:LysM repeat protein